MIVVAGRSEMPWSEDGEADVAVAMSMQPDGVPKAHRARQESLEVLYRLNVAAARVVRARPARRP